MEDQKIYKAIKFASKLTVGTFFIGLCIFPVHKALALNEVPVYINSGGYVYFECSSPISTTTVTTLIEDYKGVYPDDSTLISNNPVSIPCGTFNNGTETMEDAFINGAVPTNDGDYWTRVTFVGGYQIFWKAQRNDGVWSCTGDCSFATSTVIVPTIPINKNIEIINPTYATTTATTTFQVVINFKTPFSIDFRPTTTRHFEIVDAVTGELNYSYDHTVPANSSENMTLNISASTTEGSKFIRAMYLDTNGGIYSEVDEVFFNVATNTYFIATGLLSPRENVSGLTQIDCGTFEFGCQIQKAITFLFVPDQDVLNKFTNLWQTIAEKKPFGYVTVTINQLEELNTSGATAFTLGDIPFMDSIFSPFRALMASILWALFAIYFYKNRLIHLDI